MYVYFKKIVLHISLITNAFKALLFLTNEISGGPLKIFQFLIFFKLHSQKISLIYKKE